MVDLTRAHDELFRRSADESFFIVCCVETTLSGKQGFVPRPLAASAIAGAASVRQWQ